MYLISYGYKAPELPIIVTTLTVAALGEIAPFELPAIQEGGKEPLDEALIARRAVFLDRKLTKYSSLEVRDQLRVCFLLS